MYFELLNLSYANAQLTIMLASLVEGLPDQYIGTPLVIDDSSTRFTLIFNGVSEFRSIAEPCFVEDGTQQKITEFLHENIGSEYIKSVCPAGVGARETARHFSIYTESVVIDVLAQNKPQIK